MRAGTLAGFAIGFAAGLVALTGVLWFTGAVRRPQPATQVQAVTTAPTPEAPPVQAPPAPSATQGTAERLKPENARDHPIVPIAGVHINQLRDTFSETRNGHEHEALDIPEPRGTPVLAAIEGNVMKLFHSKAESNTVYQFDDSQTYCYYYAHLDRYASGLQESTLLRQGQVLGYVGSTGNADPQVPQLHFAVFRLGLDKSWWRGTAINPLSLLQPARP